MRVPAPNESASHAAPLGRGAIVTGGAGYLGRAIASALRERGCRVAVLDRDEAALARLGADPDMVGIASELTDAASAERAVEQAWERIGQVSILVNAVGLIYSAPLINVTARGAARRHDLAAWRRVIDANLTAVFLVTSLVVDRMAAARTRGVIVSLSSVAAHGNAGQGAYSAAKAGVDAMTRAWAKELGALGIRFVSVSPGFIDTPSTRGALSDAALNGWVQRTPLGRLGQPDEVADAVLLAISNDYLTGQVIPVDGGLAL